MKKIKPDGLYPQAPYAYAAVVAPSTLVFAAGACPLDEAGVTVAPGDLVAQTAQAVSNLFATLRAAGSSPSQVLKTTVFVVAEKRSDLVRAWEVVRAAFGDADPPSTLLGVSFLGYPGQLVEIEAIAVAAAPSET
ncbi:MAG: RidA family protein [Candidatus Eremiobacteraeota bacterium]|nr:RidA family protein [Candidatus Eremiobacteraeota bacterium]